MFISPFFNFVAVNERNRDDGGTFPPESESLWVSAPNAKRLRLNAFLNIALLF